MGTRRGVPAMSAVAGVALQSYDPDWEARWERANAGFQRWKAIASARDPSDDEYYRALEAMELAAPEMRRAYTAQFRTVEQYHDWRLKWLRNGLAWPWLNIPVMPAGLTINEVRRRLDDAEHYLSALRLWCPHGPRPDQIRRLRAISRRPPPRQHMRVETSFA